MNTFTHSKFQFKRAFAIIAIFSLVASAFPAPFLVAKAASTGISTNISSFEVAAGARGNFVVTVSNDDATFTAGTYVSVSDASNGGAFHNGTTGGDCNAAAVDSDNQFAITGNKGICYSNATPGTYTITVKLFDVANAQIGSDVEVDVTVTEAEEKKVNLCHATASDVVNPFNYLNIAEAAVLAGGHTEEAGDIIEPFGDFDGQNLSIYFPAFDMTGQQILDAKCPKVPEDATPDADSDGIPDTTDNCVNVANANQLDTDNDEVGDVCEAPDPVCEDDGALNYNKPGECDYDDGRETITACKYNAETEESVEGWGMIISNNQAGESNVSFDELTTGENGCVSQVVYPEDGPFYVTEEGAESWTQVTVEATGYGSNVVEGDKDSYCTFFPAPALDKQVQEVNNSEQTEASYMCSFFNSVDEVNQCIDNEKAWADAVHWSLPGLLKNGDPITDLNRTNPDATLGESDWVPNTNQNTGFFSLGFGGSIKVAFETYVIDVEGADISIHEATNGDNYPLEQAEVWVSQNGDDWFMIGTANNTTGNRVTYHDFSGTGLDWIKYVKVVDISNPALHVPTADGFDLDAVDATESVCKPPKNEETEGKCEVEGHKYNRAIQPLSGWFMGLGKVFTFGEGETYVYDLATDVTDEDGYYCLEWDLESRTPRADQGPVPEIEGPYSFVYIVYEKLQTGWSNWGVDVNDVANEEAENDGTYVSVEITESGYHDPADSENNVPSYLTGNDHVDFYNEQDSTNGGGDDDTFEIYGFVWHDEDEDDDREEGENNLQGWTVRAVNTQTEEVRETTTDADGRYEFNVPAGTWKISEETEDGWVLLSEADGDGTYTVTVPAPIVTMNEDESVFAAVMNYLVPTAHAVALDPIPVSYGAYNFGNDFNANNGNGGNNNNSRRRSNSGTVAGDSTSAPEGQVLGDATSTLPVGAPNTGAGGTSHSATSVPAMFAILSVTTVVRKSK